MSIEFWFEFASTYSYPAAMRIERATSDAGIPLVWRSFLLGPIFQAQGWDDSPFNIYPAKGRYMWRDVERVCEVRDLAWKRPTVFPRGSLLATRIACRYAGEAWIGDFIRDVYEANFVRDEPISDAAVIARSLERAGQTPQPILEAAGTQLVKDQLRQQTERAMHLGIFGAPTLVVGDELFWGGDRIEQAIAWHARATK